MKRRFAGAPLRAAWWVVAFVLCGVASVAQAEQRFAITGALAPQTVDAQGRFAVVATVSATSTSDSADRRFALKRAKATDALCGPVPNIIFWHGFEDQS